jgi:hypothetical protein
MTKGIVALHPIHQCKNRYHLPKNDDILFLQRELSNDFPLAGSTNREDLENKLSDAINQLIEKDFSKLVMILYRLDVSESKLKQKLKENTGENAGKLIAGLIIERQLQKQKNKQQSQSRTDIPDDEKW